MSHGQQLINLTDEQRMSYARRNARLSPLSNNTEGALIQWIRGELTRAGYNQEAEAFNNRMRRTATTTVAAPQSYGQQLLNLNDEQRIELANRVRPEFVGLLDMGMSRLGWIRDQLSAAGYRQEAEDFYNRLSPLRRLTTEAPIMSRRYLLFQEAAPLLQSGQIRQYIIDPENQVEVCRGMTRITLIGNDGNEYDVVARYDPQTNQIYPPV